MKNTKNNQENWLNKVYETMKIGGKSDKTYLNYKSHMKRFLEYYGVSIDIETRNFANMV